MFKDKLFLLSYSEVDKYLPTKKSRKCKYNGWHRKWWLRSPGNYSYNTAIASSSGSLYRDGHYVYHSDSAVRPALHLNLAHLQSLERTKNGYVKFAGRKWIILDNKTGLLLAKKGVGLRRFNKLSNNYEYSEIRAYLNAELLAELFTEKEQGQIVDTFIDGETSYSSIMESKRGHKSRKNDASNQRVCKPKYLEDISITCIEGQCVCKNIVTSQQKFCDQCGIGLDWENVHK